MDDTTEADSALATSPEAAALVKDFADAPIPRCDACGYDVTEADGHICDRKGGRVVKCHPRGCAVKGCAVARRGTILPSLSHHAGHMQWHLDQWEKEKGAPGGAVAVAPLAITVDRWTAEVCQVDAQGGALSSVLAPSPTAVCVALLFSGSKNEDLLAECFKVGQAPLAAYQNEAAPMLALVPVDGHKPGEGGDVAIYNTGLADAVVRVGARWELNADG